MSSMTELQENLEHLEVLKKQVELKNMVERLRDNPDYQTIIQKGFCEEEMQRNLGLAVCDKLPAETRELCVNLAKASATLDNYLNTVVRNGLLAEEDIPVAENYIEELRMQGEE